MSTALVSDVFGEIDVDFRWKPADQRDSLLPSNMATRHLFNTVKMIWNHTMPFKFKPFKRYSFGAVYTPDYMGRAVLALGAELFRRDDIEPYMVDILKKMAEFLQQQGPCLEARDRKALQA